jgi:gliding motility-associated-like protein
MQKLLKIYLLLIVFPFTGYAQQLIYNQSFENILSNSYPYSTLNAKWYEYNQITSTVNTIGNMNTHTHAFSFSVDTVSKNNCYIYILRAYGDPLGGGIDSYIAVDGTKFLAILKGNQKDFIPSYYSNAYISGIALETKVTLQQGNYYLCRFFSYSDTIYSPQLNITPGLLVGVSSSQDKFGSTIAHVYTQLGPLNGWIRGDGKYHWKKFSVLFQSPIAANQLTFMGDYDTTYSAFYGIDGVSLYPVKFSSTRTANLCKGDSLRLKALLPGNNYEWSTGDSGFFITVKDTGLYQCYIYTNDTLIVDSVVVKYTTKSNLREKDRNICAGDSLVLNTSTLLWQANYLWNTGDTSLKITINQGGMYLVKIHDSACTFIDTFIIHEYEKPPLNLPSDTILCDGSILILDAKNVAYTNYLWNTGDTTSQINVYQNGTYTVKANNSNCTITDSTTLKLINCYGYHLYMPNVFTPNGDKINDTFKGYGEGILEFEMHIYYRWGEEVFTTTDMNKGWDGIYRNNPCTADTYFWTITYRLKNEAFNRNEKGTVMLLK